MLAVDSYNYIWYIRGMYDACICMCVLHITPFFLHIGIQHTQCPRRFFLLLIEIHKTTTQRCYIVIAVSRVDNAMAERRTK